MLVVPESYGNSQNNAVGNQRGMLEGASCVARVTVNVLKYPTYSICLLMKQISFLLDSSLYINKGMGSVTFHNAVQ
jgi:hypothetical protein